MRSVKSKQSNPVVRTVGQLSSGGRNYFSTNSFGPQNMSGEPARRVSEHEYETAWSKVHRTFSNNLSPRSTAGDCPDNEPRFCTATVGAEPQPKSTKPVEDEVTRPCSPVDPRTSDSGVQVNIYHCQECRRHIKYGKSYKLENSCTESDSENNQISSFTCTNCKGGGQTSHCETDLPLSDHLHSPQSEVISPSPKLNVLSKHGEKLLWLSNIKLMTVAILIAPLIVCLTQLQFFKTASSGIIYFLNYLVEEEIEEDPSIVGWLFDFLFGVQGLQKPPSLFTNLF